MSFRYKFDGAWDAQLPPELREPYAYSRSTGTPYGTQRPGPYLCAFMGCVFAALVAYIIVGVMIVSPPSKGSGWAAVILLAIIFSYAAWWTFRYAFIRLSWAHKVKQLTGVNPLTWDLTKPLPTRGNPDTPLRRNTTRR